MELEGSEIVVPFAVSRFSLLTKDKFDAVAFIVKNRESKVQHFLKMSYATHPDECMKHLAAL